jgi:outer membrane lipoprotein-sorting protein
MVGWGRGRRAARLLLVACLCACSSGLGARSAAAQAKSGWLLEDVIKQLDANAKSFQSLTASVERTKVTVVVNDRSIESGEIFVRRDAKMLLEMTKPDPRTILRDGDNLYLYQPKIKRVEQYDLGKHRALVDQFLLLGFGTSGNDLKKAYVITVQGEQPIDHRRALWLELTPMSDEVRRQISKIHLWIDLATWLPVQQRFFETGSGDYFEIHYTNIIRNPRIPDSRFKSHWPKDVTKVKPRG